MGDLRIHAQEAKVIVFVCFDVNIFKKILSVDKSPRLILLISCKRKSGDNQIRLIAGR